VKGPWKLEVGEDGYGVLTLDVPGRPANVLDLDSLDALGVALREALESDVRGLLVRSARPLSFCDGADLQLLCGLADSRDPAVVREAVERGQGVLRELRAFPRPTVALVQGACIGAGLELALHCSWRVAALDDPGTVFQLPQVRLGYAPMWGGCSRAAALLSLPEAVAVAAEGARRTADEALAAGMVDELVPAASLEEAGRRIAKERPSQPRPAPHWSWPGLRHLLLRRVEGEMSRGARGAGPPSLAALACVRRAVEEGEEEGRRAEADAATELLAGPVCGSLLALYRDRQAVRRSALSAGEAHPPFARAGIVGAGSRGGALAWLLASRGIPVRVRDVDWDRLGGALREARARFEEAVAAGRCTEAEARDGMERISATTGWEGFRPADLVVEAVPEGGQAEVLDALADRAGKGAVVVTTTRTQALAELGRGLRPRGKLAGMQILPPVESAPLVEVVQGRETSPEAVDRLRRLVVQLGKLPVLVRDTPGRLVARLLAVYLGEAMALSAEGASPEAVDSALAGFGMREGPFALIDTLGLRAVEGLARELREVWPERVREPVLLPQLLEMGREGREGGAGFYDWKGDGPVLARKALGAAGWAPGQELAEEAIGERLILPMVDEAARALTEGVVGEPREADLAAVLGAGFPPARGGPLRFADSLGLQGIVERLHTLAEEHPNLAPSTALVRHSAKGGFYALSASGRATS
jgi:3-hydroxyacyl-CoA dehydrogenase/enoyl-CoA hydratase/3-hydroxybutyryl-CoA epimerase